MSITVQLPGDLGLVQFPDDTPDDVIDNSVRGLLRERGVLEPPSAGDIFGAGVDLTQGNLYSAAQGLADEYVQGSQDPGTVEIAQKFSDFLSRKRQENFDQASQVTQDLTDPSEILSSPLTVAKEQVLLNAPQALGFMAATLNPLGEVTGPLVATTYFTGSNLERQRQVSPDKDTEFSKAVLTGAGQAYLEKLVGDALLPGISKLAGGVGDDVVGGVTKEVAEEATKQSLFKQFGKKLAQATGLGVSTEVAQQALERAQAGLDLNDKDAFNEYVDSAIGGAIFAGIGAPFSAFGERMSSNRQMERIQNLEKQAKENFTPEDLLKLQVAEAPNPPVDINIVPDIEQYSDNILKDSGFDPSKFENKEEKVKAASVVLKNITEAQQDDVKTQDLKSLGFTEDQVKSLKNRPDVNFSTTPVEILATQLDPDKLVDEIVEKLKEARTEESLNEEVATKLITDTTPLVTETDPTSTPQRITKQEDVVSPTVETVPTTDVSPKTGRKILKIKEDKVKQTIGKNIKEEGYQSFPEDGDDTYQISNFVSSGIAPDDVITAHSYERGLNSTIEQFARNEKTALETRKLKDYQDSLLPETVPQILKTGEAPSQPINYQRTITPTLDKIDPIAQNINMDDNTLNFVNDTIKSANKKVQERGLGVKQFKNFKTDFFADPFVKVKTGLFLNTAIKYDNPNLMSDAELVEAFHFANENANVLSSQNKSFIKREKKNIAQHFAETVDIPFDSLSGFDTPEGMKELLGNIFAMYKRNKVSGMKGYNPQLKAIMKKVDTFLEENNKALKKRGIQDVNQLIPGFDTNASQGLFTVRDARLNKLARESAEKVHQADLSYFTNDFYKDFAEELVRATDEREGKTSWNSALNVAHNYFIRGTGTMARWALKNPAVAKMNSLIDARNILNGLVRKSLEQAGGLRMKELASVNPQQAKFAFQNLAESTAKPVVNQDGSVTFTVRKPKEVVDTNGKRSVVDEDQQVISRDPIVSEFVQQAMKYHDEKMSQFQEQYVKKPLIALGFSGNVSRGLLQDTMEILNGKKSILESNKKNNPDIQKEIDTLTQRSEILKHVINWIDRIEQWNKSIYVPLKRTGEYGLTVINKTTGKQHGFYTVGKRRNFDSFRGYSKVDLEDAIERIKSDYVDFPDDFIVVGDDVGDGKRKNYSIRNLDPNTIDLKHLTKNTIMRRLRQEKSLAGVIEDLADLAAIEGDSDTQDILNGLLETKRAVSGNYTFLLPSNKYRGYSLDVADAFNKDINSTSHYISNSEYKPSIEQLRSSLANQGYFDDNINPIGSALEKMFDYTLSPEESSGALRSLNYFMALGFNPSTAMLQMAQLATFVPSYMTNWNKNPIDTAKTWGKVMKNMGKFLALANSSGKIDNPVTFQTLINETDALTEDTKSFLNKFGSERFVSGVFAQDAMNQLVALEKNNKLTSPLLRNIGKYGQRATHLAGYLMSVTEGASRLASVDAFMRTLEDPQALDVAYNQVKDNPKFKEQVAQFKRFNATKKDNVVAFFLDEAYGVAGKQGRSAGLNSGFIGNLLFPFVGFQMQMMSSLFQSFKRSPTSGAMIVASFYVLGGLAGLPGFQNANEISKLLFDLFGDSSSDIDHEIREILKSLGVPPELNEALTKGTVRQTLGVDIGSRIGLGFPIVNELLGLTNDDRSLVDRTIVGSYVMGAAREVSKAIHGEDVQATNFIPFNALKNVVKGWSATQDTITTKKGAPLLPPQGPIYALKQALGFTPVERARMQEVVYYNSLNDRSPKLQALRNRVVVTLTNLQSTEGVKKEKYRQELSELLKEIAIIKRDHKEQFNYKSEITRAQQKAVERQRGSIIEKDPRKARDIKYYGELKE